MRIHVRLLLEGFDGERVEGDSSVVMLDVIGGCVSESEVGFKSGSEEFEVLREL